MRSRMRLRAALGLAGAAWWYAALPVSVSAQLIAPPDVPPMPHVHQPEGGPIRRATRHVGFFIHDRMIGDPAQFDIPPLGSSVYRTMSSQKHKADLHRFTLYQSDFLAGTDQLAPGGAYRLSLMASRLPMYSGPVVIEWTPEAPPLALSRREAIVGILRDAGHPIGDLQVVVGPSPYPGLIGVDAANNFDTLIFRDIAAPRAFSLTPRPGFQFGGQP